MENGSASGSTPANTQSELYERLRQQQGTPPACLYHYTTAEGLLGIVSTGTLWATGIRYLNDSREYQHALEIARDLLEGTFKFLRAPSAASSHTRMYQVLLGVLSSGVDRVEAVPIYVSCLSERADQLSQWRAYGRGGGYAVGFSPTALLWARTNTRKAELMKCVYDEEQQQQDVASLIGRLLEAADRLPPGSSNERVFFHECGEDFASNLMVAAAVFKHPSFQEEAEWRLIVRGAEQLHERNFRTRSGIIVPYLELPVKHPATPLALDSIHIGPGVPRSESESGLKALLDEHSVLVNNILHSRVPYRAW